MKKSPTFHHHSEAVTLCHGTETTLTGVARGRSASWFLLPLVRTNDGTRAFRSGVLIFVFSFENLFIFHVRTE